MRRPRLAILAIGFCLAVLLSGCGGSSSAPLKDPPLIVTTTSIPNGVINVPYTTTLSAIGGGPPYAWNVASGNLPPGLTLNRTGVLSSTPTATGSFGFTVAVADSEHPPSVANGTFSITVNAALQIATTSLPNDSPGVFYDVTLAATGGIPPYTWTIVQGSLPNGFTLNSTSGVISGTPTATGTSSFTVQVSDAETPPATASADLSITINPAPPRGAAMYLGDQTGLQIQSDGSLTLLPSSPESAISRSSFAASPTLAILFQITYGQTPYLQWLLVNPDYSLTLVGQGPLPGSGSNYGVPVVDPTGSNVYVPGPIDSILTAGITIYSGGGSAEPIGTIAIPNVNQYSPLVFTPDGSLGFISTFPSPNIFSYTRHSDGTLSPGPVYVLPQFSCAQGLIISPDGRYLARWCDSEVQVYSIATDGTLSPASQAFTVLRGSFAISVSDMTWDQSGSFLLASTLGLGDMGGGIAVLSFSGGILTEVVNPNSEATIFIVRLGSFVYTNICQPDICVGSDLPGYSFQNGQLTPLPGSPYPYGAGAPFMVIY